MDHRQALSACLINECRPAGEPTIDAGWVPILFLAAVPDLTARRLRHPTDAGVLSIKRDCEAITSCGLLQLHLRVEESRHPARVSIVWSANNHTAIKTLIDRLARCLGE